VKLHRFIFVALFFTLFSTAPLAQDFVTPKVEVEYVASVSLFTRALHLLPLFKCAIPTPKLQLGDVKWN